MKTMHILVDPNDDTGADDGIFDRMEMTPDEAQTKNDNYRNRNSDLRWIKERGEDRPSSEQR